MTQSNNRFLDEFARLMTDAAGVAQGLRDETSTFMRGQAERVLNTMDLVQRDEFEAVRLMAEKARQENEAMAERIALLEAVLEKMGTAAPATKQVTAKKVTAKKAASSSAE